MERVEVMAYRIRAQELDAAQPRPSVDAAIVEFGVQDTGRDGASWALANRGVPVGKPADLESDPDLALVWTLRSAPHYYRRRDLPDVLTATSPFSEADATPSGSSGRAGRFGRRGSRCSTVWPRWPASCRR